MAQHVRLRMLREPQFAADLAERVEQHYTRLMPVLRQTSKLYGYALTVHGSLRRDIDLVAVPWADDARPPEELAAALLAISGGFLDPGHADQYPLQRAHGRLTWAIHLGDGPYIDLSVISPRTLVLAASERPSMEIPA